MQIRLNDRVIERAKAEKGARVELWDTEVRGLGLRVDAVGRRVFNFKYQFRGDQKRVVLGEWPELSLVDARIRARSMRNDLDEGNAPHLAELPASKEASFRDFAQMFMDKYVNLKLRATTATTYEYVLRRVLIPTFGIYQVGAVTCADVEDFHASLDRTPRLANLALSILSRLFTQASRWGYRARGDNPCYGVERYETKARNRYLTDQEIARLWVKLDELERTGGESIWVCRAIKLALLTGMRRLELSSLRWDVVDLEERTILLRQHKTSRKVGERMVALSPQAVELLQGLPKVPGNTLVFPGLRPGTKANLDDAWVRIRKSLEMENVHFHDFRHTFGTLANKGKAHLHHIGEAMGIASESTVKIYVHRASDEAMAVADVVGDRIQKLQPIKV